MQYDIWHFFYLRTSGQAYDTDAIERTFAELNRCGWAVEAHPPSGAPRARSASPSERPLGVSADARRALRRYVETSADEVRFDIYPVARDEQMFGLSLHPEFGVLMLDIDGLAFTDDDGTGRGLAQYLHWLDVVTRLYAIWRPVYGFESAEDLTEGFVERNDALALNITRLFSRANIFGPELASILGRQRLLSAPAAYVAALPDGGVLLAPRIFTSLETPPFTVDSSLASGARVRLECRDTEAVARHIGKLQAFDWDAHLRERARTLYHAVHQAAS